MGVRVRESALRVWGLGSPPLHRHRRLLGSHKRRVLRMVRVSVRVLRMVCAWCGCPAARVCRAHVSGGRVRVCLELLLDVLGEDGDRDAVLEERGRCLLVRVEG